MKKGLITLFRNNDSLEVYSNRVNNFPTKTEILSKEEAFIESLFPKSSTKALLYSSFKFIF